MAAWALPAAPRGGDGEAGAVDDRKGVRMEGLSVPESIDLPRRWLAPEECQPAPLSQR